MSMSPPLRAADGKHGHKARKPTAAHDAMCLHLPYNRNMIAESAQAQSEWRASRQSATTVRLLKVNVHLILGKAASKFLCFSYTELVLEVGLIKMNVSLGRIAMSDLMDSFRLDGKVALVTGATYGIGMAIAEALGEAGAKIAFNARHADKVAEAEKHYRELGFDAHGYVADVTDETVVAELIAKIEADFGTTPDILVNNAGVIQRTPMLDMSAEDFRRVVDIDLNAPFIVSKACLPGMIAKGHGKIINICSMMSELGRETIAGYAAAKGGLKMLTKNICSEFGEANIQCNGIGPGYIATPQTAPLRETQPDGRRHPFDQFIIAKTPAARWGTPEDLKGPAVFLASDASNFVNGHILYVDGGILAYIGKQPQ